MFEKKYVMKEIGLEELRTIQLDILKDVHDFCVKNGINYYLGYGTLIGAIRHNGYIPWDDDIDICMPRPDYAKFMLLYNTRDTVYRFVCMENDQQYSLPWGKVVHSGTEMRETMYSQDVYGVYIDVFPIDGCDGEGNSIKFGMALHKLINAKKAVIGPQRTFAKNCLLCFGKVLLAFTSTRAILDRFKKVCERNNYDQSKYVACLMDTRHGIEGMFPKEWMLKTEDHSFEGFDFKVPVMFDAMLRCLYGDYMTLPPVEKRVSTHSFVAYWK